MSTGDAIFADLPTVPNIGSTGASLFGMSDESAKVKFWYYNGCTIHTHVIDAQSRATPDTRLVSKFSQLIKKISL